MGNIIENGSYCVYVHTSPIGKMYVGQTGMKPEERWGKNGKGYMQKKNGKYTQPAFAYAIQKYGWDDFEHEIIACNLTKEEADNFEKTLIKKLNTMDSKYGYNLREGGNDSHISEETKKKISESLKGNIISDSARRKLSDSMKGKLLGINSPCAKKVVQYDMQGNLIKIWDSISDVKRELNLNQGNIGKCCANESGGNAWKTVGGYIWRYFGEELTKEHIEWCSKRKNSRLIAQYSLSGEFIRVFESMSEAELKTGINHSNISACCNGRREAVGGYIWKYYNEHTELTKQNIKEGVI